MFKKNKRGDDKSLDELEAEHQEMLDKMSVEERRNFDQLVAKIDEEVPFKNLPKLAMIGIIGSGLVLLIGVLLSNKILTLIGAIPAVVLIGIWLVIKED